METIEEAEATAAAYRCSTCLGRARVAVMDRPPARVVVAHDILCPRLMRLVRAYPGLYRHGSIMVGCPSWV
jgi:hypothetical protein